MSGIFPLLLPMLIISELGWSPTGDVNSCWVLQTPIFGSILWFFSSSLAGGDHQWGWWPMGDDSSRWVSRTPRWQSPRLHHQLQPPSLHLGKLLGNPPVLISTLCPPDSDGWASKWGEMGLLTSRLFCNVGPTLPSTLFLPDMVYLLKGVQECVKVPEGWSWLTPDICLSEQSFNHFDAQKWRMAIHWKK